MKENDKKIKKERKVGCIKNDNDNTKITSFGKKKKGEKAGGIRSGSRFDTGD